MKLVLEGICMVVLEVGWFVVNDVVVVCDACLVNLSFDSFRFIFILVELTFNILPPPVQLVILTVELLLLALLSRLLPLCFRLPSFDFIFEPLAVTVLQFDSFFLFI